MIQLRRPTTLLYHSKIISTYKHYTVCSTKSKKYLTIILVKSTELIWPKVHMREPAMFVLTTRADTSLVGFSDRPVSLVVSDPDCKAGGRGFDSHPGQTLCDEHNCLFCVWV